MSLDDLDLGLLDMRNAFRRLAEAQALTGVPILVPAHKPPMTAREALQLLVGAEHGNHSVAEFDPSVVSLVLACSCGRKLIVSTSTCMQLGVTFTEVRHALRNAPRKPLGKAKAA